MTDRINGRRRLDGPEKNADERQKDEERNQANYHNTLLIYSETLVIKAMIEKLVALDNLKKGE